MRAFFDESERSNGVFAVCGYGFWDSQAKKLNKAWSRMLGERQPFHMRELVHRRGVFKGISQAEKDAFIREAAEIIARRAAVSVSVLCYIDEMNVYLSPRHVAGLRHAYGFCSHLAMLGLGAWVGKKFSGERVDYVFEAGHQAQGNLRRFVRLMSQIPEFVEGSRMRTHAFMDKEESGPLQAADMLAWEMAKFWHETVMEDRRQPRKSLQTIMLTRKTKHLAFHLAGAPLQRAMDDYMHLAIGQAERSSKS